MSKRVLGELIETQKGYAFKSSDYTNKGIGIIRVSDFTEDSVNINNIVYIPNKLAENYKQYQLSKNDVVIQTVGSWPRNPQSVVGKVIRIPQKANKYLLNQNAVKIIPKKDILNLFLFYLLKNKVFTKYIIGRARGAANQASITLEDIKGFEFVLPNTKIQEKIANVLSNYDDLIENNNNRIKLLEEIAKKTYKQWFVDFKFPGYETAKFKQSELGNIPEDWTIKSFSQIAEINPQIRLPKEGTKPFLAMDGLSTSSMLIQNIQSRSGNSGSKFQNGDTLFARITPCLENGKIGFVQFLPEKNSVAFGSTEFVVLRSRTVCPEFIYLTARLDEFRNNAIKSMSGASGRQRIHIECFDKYLIAEPPLNIIKKFQEIVEPIFRETQFLSLKNENLRKTRDVFLPRLISGEIDVEEMEIR